MIAEWPEFQLGERCTVKSSKRIFAHEYVKDGIPFMRSKDVIDKALGSFVNYDLCISKKRFMEIKKTHGSPEQGDILMSSVGNRSGQPYVIQDEGEFHFKDGNILWLSEFNDINSDYLAYWFKSDIGQNALASVMIGSAQKALTIDSIRKLWVKFPNIEYQNNAAEILKSLDNKIALNRQTNQTLEAIAFAIFKSWFVSFDPIKAKMEVLEKGGSQYDAEMAAMSVISYKSLDELKKLELQNSKGYKQLIETTKLFPSTMENGDIPQSWHLSEIGDEVQVVGGATPATKNNEFWDDGNIHWTTPKDMSNLRDKILIDTDRKITESGLKKISSGLLPKNTVLMSSRAPVGYLALAKVPLAINQGYIAMKCNDKLTPEFILQWCNFNMDEIKQRASGTTFAEISKKNFKPIPIIVPNDELIKKYTEQVKSIYDSITSNAIESNRLASIRDSFLPELLAGNFPLEEL